MSYYVYELIDPRDDSVFYVGKGKKGRIDQHEVEAAKGRQSRKCDRIREIEADGRKIVKRKVSHHKDEVEAYDAEIERIDFYGLASLTNMQSGGGRKSTGPTTYEDRILILRMTPLFQRTLSLKAKGYTGVKLMTSVLTFDWVLDMMCRNVRTVAKRRSLEWVNALAAKYGTSFVLSEPALN